MSNTGKANFFKGATATRLTTKKQASARAQSPPLEDANATLSGTESSMASRTPDESALHEQLRSMNNILVNVAADVATIKKTTEDLKVSVEGIQVRMNEAEQRISDLEDDGKQVKTKLGECDRRVEALWARVENLENRSRRNNVRLVNLSEGREQPGKMAQYVQKLFADAFGCTGAEFEVERAHRVPSTPVPDPNKPPRMVLVRFLRSSARDKILQMAREKRGCDWEGARLSIFEDVSKELTEKRKAFGPAKKRLRELQVKHRMIYPAALMFTWNGQKKTFTDGEEARRFLLQAS